MVRNRGEQVPVLGIHYSVRQNRSLCGHQPRGFGLCPAHGAALEGPERHGSWDVPIGAFTENSVGVVTGVVRAVDDEAQNVLRSTRSRGNEACRCR